MHFHADTYTYTSSIPILLFGLRHLYIYTQGHAVVPFLSHSFLQLIRYLFSFPHWYWIGLFILVKSGRDGKQHIEYF